MARTKPTRVPDPVPVAPADQARFDAVTRCRAHVEALKSAVPGPEARELELAVRALRAAIAAAPDMPPPPPPPAPVEETDGESIDPDAPETAAPDNAQEN